MNVKNFIQDFGRFSNQELHFKNFEEEAFQREKIEVRTVEWL